MRSKKKFYTIMSALVSLGAGTRMGAQTSATCIAPPAKVASLSVERVLAVSGLLTTIPLTIPPDVLASIASGALQIRSRILYDPKANTVTDSKFVVPGNLPLPTPSSYNISTSLLQTYTLSLSKIFMSCSPLPSLVFVGTITYSPPLTFGSALGGTDAISMGYTMDSPAKINNVVEMLSGLVAAYSDSAIGTVTFAPIAAIVAGAPKVNTMFREAILDGSASVGDSSKLSYQWLAAGGDIGILDPVSQMTRVRINGPAGDYPVTLTVTSPYSSDTTTVTIHYEPKL